MSTPYIHSRCPAHFSRRRAYTTPVGAVCKKPPVLLRALAFTTGITPLPSALPCCYTVLKLDIQDQSRFHKKTSPSPHPYLYFRRRPARCSRQNPQQYFSRRILFGSTSLLTRAYALTLVRRPISSAFLPRIRSDGWRFQNSYLEKKRPIEGMSARFKQVFDLFCIAVQCPLE